MSYLPIEIGKTYKLRNGEKWTAQSANFSKVTGTVGLQSVDIEIQTGNHYWGVTDYDVVAMWTTQFQLEVGRKYETVNGHIVRITLQAFDRTYEGRITDVSGSFLGICSFSGDGRCIGTAYYDIAGELPSDSRKAYGESVIAHISKRKCDCSMFVLMNSGCKCGGV